MKCGSSRRHLLVYLPVSQRAPGNLFAWTVRVEVNRKASSVTTSCAATGSVRIRTVSTSGTHGRYEELLDLLHRSPHLDLGSGLRVLHRDQDVEVFV